MFLHECGWLMGGFELPAVLLQKFYLYFLLQGYKKLVASDDTPRIISPWYVHTVWGILHLPLSFVHLRSY
ncbi:hypothetical protein BDQ17DRAFT_1354259 [Cyathus striatus]|nr:hypothetical protein BDQ17DRAFT_1354259 [Cyathus striatus]